MSPVRRVEGPDGPDHGATTRSGLEPPCPRLDRAREPAQTLGHLAGCLVADLVTVTAAVQLDGVEPLFLALEGDRHAVAFGARAGEKAPVRDLEHGEPVDGRVVRRRRGGARRHDRAQVDDLAARALDLRRIGQPVAPHPQTVGGLRQAGDHVPPVIVRDHDPGESGAELGRFRDDPDAGFRSILAGDHAADIAAADLHRGGRGLLRARPDHRPSRHDHDETDHHRARVQETPGHHV